MGFAASCSEWVSPVSDTSTLSQSTECRPQPRLQSDVRDTSGHRLRNSRVRDPRLPGRESPRRAYMGMPVRTLHSDQVEVGSDHSKALVATGKEEWEHRSQRVFASRTLGYTPSRGYLMKSAITGLTSPASSPIHSAGWEENPPTRECAPPRIRTSRRFGVPHFGYPESATRPSITFLS